MTIQEALRAAHTHLERVSMYPELTWKEAEILLGFVLQKERIWLTAHSDQPLSQRQEQRFFSFVERRTKHEPIAYLLGSGEFCGMLFEVNKHTLIPRIETEELVERAAANMYSHSDKGSGTSPPSIVVWDVGTGSGAIAVSIKKRLPNVTVIASDLSKRALRIAQKNATRLLSKDQQPIFFQGSLLTREIKEYLLSHRPSQLIILANLPYLPHSDKALLQKDVIAYEPSSALFADENGNALILQLMQQLSVFVTEYSVPMRAYFEFDPPQAHTLQEQARELFSNAVITTHKDTCGRARFLEVISPAQQTMHRPL